MQLIVELSTSARNMTHPTETPRDVSFAPENRGLFIYSSSMVYRKFPKIGK